MRVELGKLNTGLSNEIPISKDRKVKDSTLLRVGEAAENRRSGLVVFRLSINASSTTTMKLLTIRMSLSLLSLL